MAHASAVPTPRRPRFVRLALRLGLSLGVGAFFVWVMREAELPWLPGREAFARVHWWTAVAYLIGWSIVHVLRAARWQLLLSPIATVSLKRVCAASFVGFLAIMLLPFRTGEVVRPVLIREKGRLSAWAALGTLGAERIVDGLVFCLILFAGLWLSTPLDPLPERLGELAIPVAVVPQFAYAALFGFSLALCAMGAFYVWKAPARRLTEFVIGFFSKPLAEWGAARVEKLASGLRFLSGVRHSLPFVLVTIAYWTLNAACTWLLAWGVGFPNFSYAQACVVTGVLALGVLLPNAPAFFGAFQFALYAGLAMFYPKEQVLSEGSVLVLVVYAGQTLVTVGFAIWGVVVAGVGGGWQRFGIGEEGVWEGELGEGGRER